MVYCQKCGLKLNTDANFCPECGAAMGANQLNLPTSFFSSSPKLILSGILIIFASILSLRSGISYFEIYMWNIGTTSGTIYLLFVLFNILGFCFGIMAALYIFQRKNYQAAFRFTTFLLICGLITFMFRWGNFEIILLGILGLIFLTLSKYEFDLYLDTTRSIEKKPRKIVYNNR